MEKGQKMENYIRVYDNVLDESICKSMIEKFEINTDQQEKTILKGHRSFKEITLNKFDDWKPSVDGLYETFKGRIGQYAKDVNITNIQWPIKYGFEAIRMKKYMPNNIDEFKEHVDVGDYASARRFLVFFLYLDDNEAGETSFTNYDIKVKPKAGRLLMFPPTWTYLHTGHKPKDKPKYIIGSYLHYV